jgi:hypothetical protein
LRVARRRRAERFYACGALEQFRAARSTRTLGADMGNAGSQAYKFYEEVARNGTLWFAENSAGTALEFDLDNGKVSFPLWSSESRIKRLRKLNPKLFGGFVPRQMSWASFKDVLVPILRNKQRVVGVNLSGPELSGFDISVESVIRQVEGVRRAIGA